MTPLMRSRAGLLRCLQQRTFTKPLTGLDVACLATPGYASSRPLSEVAPDIRRILAQPQQFHHIARLAEGSTPMAPIAIGILGREAVLGNAMAVGYLRTFAHSEHALAKSCQAILDHRQILQAIVAPREALAVAKDAARLADGWLDALLHRLDAGEDRRGLAVHAETLYAGPGAVLARLWDAMPRHGKVDDINLARTLFHDAVRIDISSLHAFATYAVDSDYPTARLRLLLRPKATSHVDMFIRHVMALAKSRTNGAGPNMTLGSDIPYELMFHERVDLQALRLIISELVWNAIKYANAEKRGPRVDVSWDALQQHFIIADNGIGIKATAAVWELGFREGRAPESSGEGLGLWSVHQRATQLQWEITMTSAVGVGTRFVLTPRPGDIFTPGA